MLNAVKLDDILFLDIETVPQVYRYDDVDEDLRDMWAKKNRFLMERDGCTAADLYTRAGIYAEFGKIVCISTAIFYEKEGKHRLRVKSFCDRDEKALLSEFARVIEHFGKGKTERFLCGHNIREFDVPFIARRMVLHGLKLPEMFNLAGKKPWEVRHLDTMELWKFGDYKHFTSLNLLARIFGIPTPKDDISGEDVSRVFWEEDDLERIKTYCEKDTVTTARIMQRFKNLPLIPDEDVEHV